MNCPRCESEFLVVSDEGITCMDCGFTFMMEA